jgi:signal transduction histidine kinase
MAMGNLEQQVPVRTADELGELAQSFNKMSSEVAHANQSRRQMTADIAHDLRNPLTVISGYLESFQDNRLQPTLERFATMQAEVDNLQRLVEDLRMLSLADSGDLVLNLQPVNVIELLEHTANAYQTLADEKNITLSVQVEPGLPQVSLDPDRIEQVLGNLISNALRYTPAGGQISLNAGRSGDRLTISVEDNGSGIPSEAIPYIFERSYRDDTSRSGSESGLGLAIAKSIVELHGGMIGVETMIGSGSRFWIRLNI